MHPKGGMLRREVITTLVSIGIGVPMFMYLKGSMDTATIPFFYRAVEPDSPIAVFRHGLTRSYYWD